MHAQSRLGDTMLSLSRLVQSVLGAIQALKLCWMVTASSRVWIDTAMVKMRLG